MCTCTKLIEKHGKELLLILEKRKNQNETLDPIGGHLQFLFMFGIIILLGLIMHNAGRKLKCIEMLFSVTLLFSYVVIYLRFIMPGVLLLGSIVRW